MEYSNEYGKAFGTLAERMNLDFPLTPYQAIVGWKQLVDEIREGYQAIQLELDFDLQRIREPLETFLVADDLAAFEEHTLFKKVIQQLDEEFKALSVENPVWKQVNKNFRWWENRVLKYGSAEYANFINSRFAKDLGYKVEIVK